MMQVVPSYKIQVQSFSVKLKKQYLKIITLFPGPNNTFILLAMVGIGTDVLVHINAEGTALYQYKFSHPVDSIGIVSTESVIAPETRLNQITVFNLSNHTKCHIPFNFLNEESDQTTLYTFTNSKHICIVQNGRYNDNRLKLSYFSSPLHENSKPFNIYETDSEWNYQYMIKKGNEQSMMMWFRSRHDEQFEIKRYSCEEDGKFECYRIKNQIGVQYGYASEVQTALLTAWQVQSDRFCLVCNTEKTNLGLKNNAGCVNNNFIWDVKVNQLRESEFWFDEKYNDYLIDVHSMGEFSIFRTYFFQNQVAEETPVYYVHNRSEKIVAKDVWRCSYLSKFQYPAFDRIIVESEYDNADVSEFRMKVKRIVRVQQ